MRQSDAIRGTPIYAHSGLFPHFKGCREKDLGDGIFPYRADGLRYENAAICYL
jgi:hypothetical protein